MPEARDSDHHSDVEVHAAPRSSHPDQVIAALAAGQHGVVSRRQLLDAGMTRPMVERRLASRHLVPLHRGVYAIGHDRLTRDGHWFAAVLATGPGAALSHREAAALHELRPASRSTVDVTVAAQRRVPGVRVHRAKLDPEDVTTVVGIPVTTVARTLVDLAAVVPADRLRKALDEAERTYRLDVRAIEAVLGRTRGRNGSSHGRIRRALADMAAIGATVTHSVLEDGFLALLDAHDLPQPRTNMYIHGMQVDACWPRERVVVETDGWAYHHTRMAFQDDRTRSNVLQAEGYVVLRFTHDDVVRRPAETVDRIGRALRRDYAAAPTG
jgi:very-short-patch-repair endonuclease/predicted transcriptional regulator of viral defense system